MKKRARRLSNKNTKKIISIASLSTLAGGSTIYTILSSTIAFNTGLYLLFGAALAFPLVNLLLSFRTESKINLLQKQINQIKDVQKIILIILITFITLSYKAILLKFISQVFVFAILIAGISLIILLFILIIYIINNRKKFCFRCNRVDEKCTEYEGIRLCNHCFNEWVIIELDNQSDILFNNKRAKIFKDFMNYKFKKL